MKKLFYIAIAAIMFFPVSLAAQEALPAEAPAAPVNPVKNNSKWTLNTRAWCTNYFTTMLLSVAEVAVSEIFEGHPSDSLWAERLMPAGDVVFPIGVSKKGFGENDIYGPYHRAWSNPFKNIGDYAIGIDASYKPSLFGFYAGAYFKSQEVVYKQSKDNIRGFYIQPRAGIIIGYEKASLEAGVFYDILTGAGGSLPGKDKDMLKGGVGLDFAFSSDFKGGRTIIQFSLPLHNFFNNDYQGLQGVKRKVAYITLSRRVYF